jgi:hypothetical protein
MRKLLLVVALVFAALQPISASAQQSTTQAVQDLPLGKAVAIGVGVVVGAVLLQSVAAGDLVVVAGGVVGGLIGAWWYENDRTGLPRVAIRDTNIKPASYRILENGAASN